MNYIISTGNGSSNIRGNPSYCDDIKNEKNFFGLKLSDNPQAGYI